MALAIVGLGTVVQADTVTWNFLENGQDASLGASSTFTESGIGLTAYASSGETLYAKNDGPGEVGLGITSDSDHEINGNNFVQLNLTTTPPVSSWTLLFLGSVQSGETATIHYSLFQGILGSQIGTVNSDGTFDISGYSTGYIGISAGSGNVVLGSATANFNTPDGGTTMMLLGGALMGLGLIKRKLSA